MEVRLRDYQQELVSKIHETLKTKKHILVQAPTGSGKTLTFSFLAKEYSSSGLKVCILSNRTELLMQSGGSLERIGVKCEYVSPRHKDIPEGLVVSSMAQTLRRRAEDGEWLEWMKSVDVYIIDECFRGDMEILTDEGFKRFDSLHGNEKVAQYSNNKEISFVSPARFIKKEHNGELCKLYLGRNQYAYMTPNHHQAYCTASNPEIRLKEIRNLKMNQLNYIPVSGYGTGNNSPLTNMERLIIALQADGTYQSNYNNINTFSIQLTKDRKKDRFLKITEELDVHEIKCKRNNTRRWMCKVPYSNPKILRDCFELNMSSNRASSFIEELVQWDGHIINNNMVYYSSKVKDNADFVAAIAVQAGYKAYIGIEHDNRKDNYSDIYRVYMQKKQITSTVVMKKEFIPYNGNVYCVEVPEHKIIVKAGGYIFVSGNCHMDDASFIFDKIRHDAKVIGFSATPKRSGKQRQLGLDYEEIVSAISIKELIAKDFLCPARYFTLDAPDLTGVKYNSATGDYQEKSMGNIFDSPKRYEGLLENWQRICPDSKTIVFCASQVHAIKTALEFEKAGVEVRYIISGIPKDDEDYHFMEETSRLTGKRKELIQAFKDNKFKVLVNAQILTAGFDCPDVETIVMNKATLSPATYIQAIGRGSRPAPGKDHFKVLDFGDNVHRLGLYKNERTWSLWHETKEGGGVPLTKECGCNGKDRNGDEGCGRLIPITMGVCPFCGYSFMTPEELRKVELREIVDGKFEFKDMTPKQMAAYCELQGYSKNYLFRQLYYGAEDRRQFVQGMRELGYDWKFSYFTYDRLSK